MRFLALNLIIFYFLFFIIQLNRQLVEDPITFASYMSVAFLSIYFLKKKTKIELASLVFPESSSERLCTFKHRKRIEFRHYFKLSCVYLTASIYGFRYFSLLLAMKCFMFYSILAPVLAY